MKMHAETISPAAWNRTIALLPGAHLLQTWEWGQVKARYGWEPIPLAWRASSSEPVRAAALVLKRTIPAGGFARKMCVLYVPKGPLLDATDGSLVAQVLDDLQALAVQQGAIFVKIDPEIALGLGVPGTPAASELAQGQAFQRLLASRGWCFSPDQIQFRNTVLLDLAASEEELLARMKQKTRYNIRLAERSGVSIVSGTEDDLPMLYRAYAETSLRDGFVIRDEAYYRLVWQTFMRTPEPHCQALIAKVADEAVAAIFLFTFAQRAYYLHGMSTQSHREKMPNYLLQWEAMRRAKAAGCRTYDLWGAPDEFVESDRMWGVFRFKEGLGGTVSRSLGAWDFTPSPILYRLYTRILPRLLDIMRWRGKGQTRQSLE